MFATATKAIRRRQGLRAVLIPAEGRYFALSRARGIPAAHIDGDSAACFESCSAILSTALPRIDARNLSFNCMPDEGKPVSCRSLDLLLSTVPCRLNCTGSTDGDRAAAEASSPASWSPGRRTVSWRGDACRPRDDLLQGAALEDLAVAGAVDAPGRRGGILRANGGQVRRARREDAAAIFASGDSGG